MKKKELTLIALKTSARNFIPEFSKINILELYGVTDGKAVGTYVEHGFHKYLMERCAYEVGSSASGVDFPRLKVDLKVTSLKQPQSSCPFRDAGQKVYGLGYHLILFVYAKVDDHKKHASRLNCKHALFIAQERTADYQTTYGIRQILKRNGNKDDLVAFLEERNLPLDELGRESLAKEILNKPPKLGCLTVSNALQWRLQHSRAIAFSEKDSSNGIENLLR